MMMSSVGSKISNNGGPLREQGSGQFAVEGVEAPRQQMKLLVTAEVHELDDTLD
jgi:hypothetical protein